MKDIHGQAPSPPIRRPKLAGAESPVEAIEASETAVLSGQPASPGQPEAPVEKAPEQRIDLDLTPSQPDAALPFDQNIQLYP
jgi:23S rRNA (guanosine2251-2'-O)-methyltransferase